MNNQMTVIAETLYDNTLFKNAMGSSVERAQSNIAIEELGALIGTREQTIPVKDIEALLRFIKRTGIEYLNLCIANKTANNVETVYDMDYTKGDKTFKVSIDYEGDIAHIGILEDIDMSQSEPTDEEGDYIV